MMHSTKLHLTFFAATALAACTGVIGGASSGDAPGSGPNPASSSTSNPGQSAPTGDGGETASTPAPGRVRRLTFREYTYSVADIFGDTSALVAGAADPSDTGFDNDYERMSMSQDVLLNYQTWAETVAGGMASRLSTLLPCSAQAGLDETSCATEFITHYGRLAYRRAVTPAEEAQLLGVFSFARGQSSDAVSFTMAIEQVASALLQSPNFLYRDELGPATPGSAGSARLTGYQLATELAYYLWVSAPDDALLKSAESGGLDSESGVRAAVARLWADPKAQRSVSAFFRQMLQIDDLASVSKSTMVYPKYSPTLATSMLGETEAFVNDVIFNRDASFATLFTSAQSFANADVAGLYGLTGGPSGSTFEPVLLNPKERAGLLTQPAFITGNTDTGEITPVLDGKAILTQIFCVTIYPPPNNVPALPPPAPGLAARERMKKHLEAGGSCPACHTQIDGAGWTLEQYDGIGQWRTQDEGVTFKTPGQGTLIGTDVDGPVTGGVGLAQKVVSSTQAKQCFDSHYLTYALGRDLDPTVDEPSIAQTFAAFESGQGNVKALIESVTRSRSFLERTSPALTLATTDGGS